MEDNIKYIPGIRMEFDKTPVKWTGTVYLQSNYKEFGEYVSSSKESFSQAIREIEARYNHKVIEGIELKKINQ